MICPDDNIKEQEKDGIRYYELLDDEECEMFRHIHKFSCASYWHMKLFVDKMINHYMILEQ